MVAFPNCKINIGLQVVGKRTDGFHDIETIFYPIALKDAIEIIAVPGTHTNFSQTGLPVPGNGKRDLCVQAYDLLKADHPHLPAVKIHLHKAIPVGAGLGGGSADATFMLKLIDQKFQLNLTQEQLIGYAIQLGSDCPFFVINEPCYATGRGEILEKVPVDLSGYNILLVNPGIHINTSWAFSQVEAHRSARSLKESVALPIEKWQQEIINDFEEPVLKQYPEIASLKQTIMQNGAIYGALSGTGSTVFGIYPRDISPDLNFPLNYFSKWL